MIRNLLGLIILTFLLVPQISCTKKSDKIDNFVHYSTRAKIDGFDPDTFHSIYQSLVATQIYEGLFEYHYLKRPVEVVPLLADGMPLVSKDGLIHTFKIKKGVMFQDDPAFPNGKGRELVAADFIYSWKRISDPRNKGKAFWIFDNKIVGLNEWREKIAKNTGKFEDPVEGLTAVDSHTLAIKLKKPFFQLYYILAWSGAVATAKEVVDHYGEEFLNHPVGTGPFMLKKWLRGSKMTMVKNPNWRGQTYPTQGAPGDEEAEYLKDAGKALPFIDGIVFYETVEDQPYWLNFIKGKTDYAEIPKDNFDYSVKSLKISDELKKKNIKLHLYPRLDLTYLGFNMEDPVLGKNVNLRRAMSLAYDSQSSIDIIYNGRGMVAQSIIPPEVDAYDPNYNNPFRKYNLEKAKEYLKKAGHPNGKDLPEFELISTTSSSARQMTEFFKNQMAKIGIKIKIATSSWPQFSEKIQTKKAQIWGMGWTGDYPDTENFVQLLYGPNSSPGPNTVNYNNAEYNKLYDQAIKLPPGPQRTKIYKKMRDIMASDLPMIPHAHRIGNELHHGWLKNFKRHSNIYNFFKFLRIDQKDREARRKTL